MFLFFKRLCAIVFGCFFSVYTLQAQTLNPGDLVIVGYNFTDPDEFSILSLVDLSPGTQFCVTDCGWNNNTSAFRTGEGLITYTVPASGIQSGQQIHYPNDPGFVTQGVSGFFGLSTAGDQLFIFQGTFTAPYFLFALTDYNGGWLNTSFTPTNQSSHLPPGLVAGETALELDLFIQARFECAFPFSHRQEFLKRLSDSHQWIKSDDRIILPVMGCGFDVLVIRKLEWTYQIKEGNLLLMVSFPRKDSEIRWLYYTEGESAAMTCRELQKGVFECEWPNSNPYCLIKPCSDEQCEPYRRIDNYTHVPLAAYQSGEGRIKVELSDRSKTFSYRLYFINGSLVKEESSTGKGEVEIQGLLTGFYILTVEIEKMLYQIPLRILD